MDRTLPHIPVEPRDVALFVAIVVTLGWLEVPATGYEIVTDRSLPTVVEAVVLLSFALSPLVAVAILVRRLQLAGGLRTFLRERLRWRADLRWHLVSVGLLPALAVVTYACFLAFDRPVAFEPTAVGLLLLEVIGLGIVFNLVENYGWRGFLQEALQSRVSALAATLAVGVVWGLWHLPLFVLPGGSLEALPVTSGMLVILGEAVIIGWLYNSTGGSVLHATLMHTSFNASFGVVVTTMVLADRSVDGFYGLTAVVVWLTVAVIVYRADPATLRWE